MTEIGKMRKKASMIDLTNQCGLLALESTILLCPLSQMCVLGY